MLSSTRSGIRLLAAVSLNACAGGLVSSWEVGVMLTCSADTASSDDAWLAAAGTHPQFWKPAATPERTVFGLMIMCASLPMQDERAWLQLIPRILLLQRQLL